MSRFFQFAKTAATIVVFLSVVASAQPEPKLDTHEQRTARAMLAAVQAGPLELHAFLELMPKGADLHNHLTGSIFAENFIAEAVSDHLCVNPASYTLVKPVGLSRGIPAHPVCSAGDVPVEQAYRDSQLYDDLIDAFSMRAFVAREGDSAHDHFFNSFSKFGLVSDAHTGEWLGEVARNAAKDNTQYLELMMTPDFGHGSDLGAKLGWNPNLEQFRQALLSHGLREGVEEARQAIESAEKQRLAAEHCAQPDAMPACKVETKFLFQVLRGFPPERVFAQMVLGFEVASSVPDVVGVNIVMPEDGRISMRDYHLQMQMFDLLHHDYPKVHLSLHAGELAPGLVPPDGLRFHIREAVELGHAQRIGHGVDVMYEDHPHQLLHELAQKHVLVEINLTSNDLILGIRGEEHPFPIYRRYGVPVALSTDDAGVSRITLTHEYVRAAATYHLTYADLKQMARASLEHSFLPGVSLWPEAESSTPEQFTRVASACVHETLGTHKPSANCIAFLDRSQRAQQQWELESRFHVFEARY